MTRFTQLLLLGLALMLTACDSTSPRQKQLIEYRRLEIAAETPGEYFIGRRFSIERTHLWGYVRRPRQPWHEAKLVMMNEKFMKQPDRYPEMPLGDGPAFGSDHNREYRLWGYYSGRSVYDPNSNLKLPEFVLQRYEVKNASPGWLFHPGERFNGKQLLRGEAGSTP